MYRYKLSLVVAIYGVERYIEQFALSALSEWTDGVQYVFVNDGTRDKSMEILERVIAERFSDLGEHIVIVNQENQGLPMARKSGLEAAEGEYILFADSDDWLAEGSLAKVMTTAQQTGADIIYFDLIKEYGNRQSIKREREYDADSKAEWIFNIFNYKSHGYGVTKCFRKAIVAQHTIFTPPLGMHEDIYLMCQIIHYAESIVHLPEPLYHYRKDNEVAMTAEGRRKRHIASSRNLLNLYGNYRSALAGSPIERVADGIVLRGAWHSLIHKVDLWSEFPWLAEAVRQARPKRGYRTALPAQWVAKVVALWH